MKYWKPESRTFWLGLSQILIGVFIAGTPMHGLHAVAQTLDALTGGMGPYPLIVAGLALIGLRAAPGMG